MADISDRIGNALFGPKGSLVDAYNQEIDRRSGPFGLEPAKTRAGAAAQMPLSMIEGLGGIADYLLDTPQAMGEATLEYLTGPSKFQRDLEAGLIQESELPLGTDLADIPGSGVGVPDFVPEDYVPGETFTYDPTGEGLTKDIDAALKELYGDLTPGPKTRGGPAALKRKAEQEAQEVADAAINKKMGMDALAAVPDDTNLATDSESMFAAAMQDFIDGARGAGPSSPEVKSIDEYKKEFADATGISIDGKPDKSQALMAFGLALMQNKAKGKGIGGMLSAIGEAGEAAMPALEKARERARLDGLAAGKYALETQSADEAKAAAASEKAMQRSQYWIYKRGGQGTPYQNFDDGKLVTLNKYELNNLLNTEGFDSEYAFITGADYMDVQKERAKQPDYGDQWDKNRRISLVGDEDGPEAFKVYAAVRNPNYTGPRGGNTIQLANPEGAVDDIMRYQKDLNKRAAEFGELVGQIEEGISIPEQIGSGIVTIARNLGIDVGDGPTSIAKAKKGLQRLAATQAKDILGEVGKTLSDRDREIVQEQIGQINFASGDEELVLQQLAKVYDLAIVKGQNNVNAAIRRLERDAGVIFNSEQIDTPDGISAEDKLEFVNKKRKEMGLPPLSN